MKIRVQRWWLASAVLVVTASLGCAATAQDAAPAKTSAVPSARERMAMEAAFSRADANGDGRLSRAEAAHLPAIEARFGELDLDHDGFLSLDEFIAGAMSTAL